MGPSRPDGAALLKHYRLQDPYPAAWSDPIEDAVEKQGLMRNSTVRYSVLQENVAATLKGLLADDGGVLPQDEPDPLGSTNSVVRVLKQRGLPVEDNLRLRSRYMVSSKHFSPAAFLRDVHANTPTPTLQQGLNYLGHSIAQKSGSLKELVESNFDRFVAAKATIEGVYKEMKENAFLDKEKEAEYGVGKIRGYLNDVDTKANEVFGPIMSGHGREEGLRLLLGILDKHGQMLEIPVTMLECIKRKEYDALHDEYQQARKYWEDSRALVPDPKAGVGGGVREEHIHQLIIAEKMWNEVTCVIEDFKKETWKRLIDCKTEDNTHMELIQVLLEVGVEDNPISYWLVSRFEYLKSKITTVFERSRVEIEVVRRKVLEASAPNTQTIAHHLRSPTRRGPSDSQKAFDIPPITAFWELVHDSMMQILDSSTGFLAELLSFWKTAQSFIDGDNLLPVGFDDQSRKHHRLSDKDVRLLRDGAIELVTLIRTSMNTFFQDPPPEDISALYSPMPNTPLSATTPEFPPIPLPVPKMKDSGDEDVYAFYPPRANSLGAVHYLGKVMVLLGRAAASLAEVFGGLGYGNLQDELRSMLSGTRERIVKALCNTWLADAQNCRFMEDWTRASDNRGVTKMPGYFLAFEKEIIGGMQSIIYLDKVRNGETSVIPPPSAKFLTSIRGQFVRTLYKALQGMVENAQKPADTAASQSNGLISPRRGTRATNLTAHSIDSQDKNTRMLLTLSNLQLLRSEIVPELISQFENAFSVKLTDESKTIRDALGQIDAQLFDEYTKPLVRSITTTVRNGILSPTWPPPAGQLATDVRPYVYEALLAMVDVHAQVTITAPSLVQQVLSHLLEQLSRELLESFRQRKTFTLGGLLQATLDVEFVNQTLSQFNTPKSSEWQQLVYVELDRGSDGDARTGLQNELGEMKKILSSLRRCSRAEFLCFRAKKSSTRRTNVHGTEGDAASR